MLYGIWDYVFGLCVPLLFKSGAWGPCSPGLVAGDSFSVSRLLSSPFLFLFLFFQRQSWIEKRGGTGCGLLAEGELNSHSLPPSLPLPLSHFLFFSVAFKINSFSGLLTQPGPESPGFMAPSNGHALNQSPAVSTILPATRPPHSLTPSSF